MSTVRVTEKNTKTRPTCIVRKNTDGFSLETSENNRTKVVDVTSSSLRRQIFTPVFHCFYNTKKPKTAYVSYLIARNNTEYPSS